MKFLVVLAVTVACAAADVSHVVAALIGGKSDESQAPIVRSSNDISPEGNFAYSYETGNGISAQADGVLKNINSEEPVLEMRGGYKYTAPDGTVVDTSYIANEDGFQPSGSHLPVSPPIPEPIARALAYTAARLAAAPEKPYKP